MPKLLAGLLCALAAVHRTFPAVGTISGVVKDAGSGAPIPNATVEATGWSASSGSSAKAVTDTEGGYKLENLAPGKMEVTVMGAAGSAKRTVTVGPGQDVTDITLALPSRGTIAGKVVDESNHTVAGVYVMAVSPTYQQGVLQFIDRGFGGLTNVDGEYRLVVPPGAAVLVLAQQNRRNFSAIAEAPTDVRLRRPLLTPTYYPGVNLPDTAKAITLRSGEVREGVDIRMPRGPSYCAEGTIEFHGAPAAMGFWFSAARAHRGFGTYSAEPMARTGPDGQIPHL
jgi:hypothetical protein